MTDTWKANPLPAAVRNRHETELGGSSPRMFFAPGRVNLVGAHLDYNGGTVLPVAVDRGVCVAASLREDGRIRLRSLDVEGAVDLDVDGIGDRRDPSHGWASYPLGVAHFFAEQTGVAAGFDLVFGGDLPIASGLSSSAAIEVATALALTRLHDQSLGPVELAKVAFLAETRYVGLQCGIMDQYASALGRPGLVLKLDCSTAEFEHVPLDPGTVDILVMDTGLPRSLGHTHYETRVKECAEAHRILRAVRELGHLAAYTEADLLAAGETLTGKPRKRAEHVVAETQRVAAAVAALRAGDLRALGSALSDSHRSARDLYEVSCPELDVLAEAAWECPEVFGARLTGAGFGGCAIALLQPGTREAVSARIESRFADRFGRVPRLDLVTGGPGPAEVPSA